MTDKINAHAWSIEQTAKELGTDLVKGLTGTEASARFKRNGLNELKEKPRPGFFSLLLDQFKDFLIIILIAAAILSIVLGEWIDAIVILAIVVLNSIIGVVQESKAEASLAALKKMAAPNARVIRDGQQQTIPARELVVGDLVMVEAGNYLPADLRLIESVNLKSDEASLTGESVPVDKNAKVVLEPDAPIGDRDNCAFSSMLVTYGRGTGIVTATGMDTQLGQIAEMLQTSEDEQTPLQIKLDQLGKTLGIVCLSICGFIFVYRRDPGHEPQHGVQGGDRSLFRQVRTDSRRARDDRRQPGDRGRARRPVRGRHRLPGARHAAHGRPAGVDPQAARGGNVGLLYDDLLRQDRHPDPEPDDRDARLGRRERIRRDRRRVCA